MNFVLLLFLLAFILQHRVFPTTHYTDKMEIIPIVTSSIYVELFCITIAFMTPGILRNWFTRYRLSAVIADVSALVIYISCVRHALYVLSIEVGLPLFMFLCMTIQIMFEYMFYRIIPYGMISHFNDYPILDKCVLGSIMVGSVVLLSSILNGFSFDVNLLFLVTGIYLIPYTVYMKQR